MNRSIAMNAACLGVVASGACAQTTLVHWNFNAVGQSPTAPAPAFDLVGGATTLLIGGAVPGSMGPFLSESGSSDGGMGQSWSIGGFPAQGTNSGTAGVEFRFATLGYANLTFEFDVRPTINVSDTFDIQCSTNGGVSWSSLAAAPFRFPGETSATTLVWTNHIGAGGALPLYSLPPAANNSTDVRVRIVSVFDPVLGNAYSPASPVNGAGLPHFYNTLGSIRIDMIEIKGSPATGQAPAIILDASSVTPASACDGSPVHIEAVVAPGTLPTSASVAMTADVSALGGPVAAPMSPAGMDGQGRWRFALDAQAALATPPGPRPIHLAAVDNANRTASGTLWFTVALCCAADLDNDGVITNGGQRDGGVDINDLLYFLQGFEAGVPAVDLDNDGDPATGQPDGGVDINDLLFFLTRFEAGC